MTSHVAAKGVDVRREALLKEYGEVASNFRLLTNIRFKLLAFLPIAAAAAAALKGTGGAEPAEAAATLGLSVFGLVVTIALVGYNARNDQLYDELVGRAAAIERELFLPDGAFAHRPNPWFAIRMSGSATHLQTWPVDHRRSVALIYGASTALWLFGAFYSVTQLITPAKGPSRLACRRGSRRCNRCNGNWRMDHLAATVRSVKSHACRGRSGDPNCT
jgi:hypothetical protein